MNYDDYLAHFNPNHDPRNGQFTSTKYQTAGGDLTKRGRRALRWGYARPYDIASQKLKTDLHEVNQRYAGKDLGWTGEGYSTAIGKKYLKEVNQKWQNLYMNELRYEFPKMIQNGESWMHQAPLMDMYVDKIRVTPISGSIMSKDHRITGNKFI